MYGTKFPLKEEDIRMFTLNSYEWEEVAKSIAVDRNFIREYKDKLPLVYLIENKNVDYDLFSELVNEEETEDDGKLNWRISFLTWRVEHKMMSLAKAEEVIKRDLVMFLGKWEWHVITELLPITNKFIESELVTRNMWETISSIKNLKETFIDRHINQLDWNLISYRHILHDHFIKKYYNKLVRENLVRNSNYRIKYKNK